MNCLGNMLTDKEVSRIADATGKSFKETLDTLWGLPTQPDWYPEKSYVNEMRYKQALIEIQDVIRDHRPGDDALVEMTIFHIAGEALAEENE